jgi:hypothetical protein
MKIPIKGDNNARYEKRQYGYSNVEVWCLTRSGVVIRWLDKFEANMIESVLEFKEGECTSYK